VRCALDRLPLVDVFEDLFDLRGRVAELLERRRDRLVDDLERGLPKDDPKKTSGNGRLSADN